MPTSRPFAYNTGSTVTGTVQLGNLAVVTGTSVNYSQNNLSWFMGPDEDLGYVIGYTADTQTLPYGGVTQGPNNGGTVSSTPIDFSFTNLNGLLGNSTYAEGFNNSGIEGAASDELQVSNFGFTIPNGVTINGIEVSLTAYYSGGIFPATIGGSYLYLTDNNNIYGVDFSYPSLTTTPTVYTIGGPTFKWPVSGNDWNGQSMTPSVVNNSQFGFGFYFYADPNQTVYVKNVTIKVYTSAGTAKVQFWRSKLLTDQSFIDISQYVSSRVGPIQTFASGSAAKTWLNNNNFWTSY